MDSQTAQPGVPMECPPEAWPFGQGKACPAQILSFPPRKDYKVPAPTTFMGFKCPTLISTPSPEEFLTALDGLRVYSRNKGMVSCMRGVVLRMLSDADGVESLVGADWAGEGVCFMVEKATAPMPDSDTLQMAIHEWERDEFIPQHNHPASDMEKQQFLDVFQRQHMQALIETNSEKVRLATYSVVVDFERSRGYIGATNISKAADVLNVLEMLLMKWADQDGNWDADAGLMVGKGMMELAAAWLVRGSASEPWKLGRSCTIKGKLGEKILYDRSSLDFESIRDYLESGADMKVASVELTLVGNEENGSDSISGVVSKTGAISRFTSALMGSEAEDKHGIVGICHLGALFLDALEKTTDEAAELEEAA